jgi:lysozyme family protein
MADFKILADKIFKWEGGFVDDPTDRGGTTNMGITLATWRKVGYDKDGDCDIDADDIRLLTPTDARFILRKYYWNRWQADNILVQAIANILVDWLWASGKWGIIIPQRILKVTDDGIVGPATLNAVNTFDNDKFLEQVYEARVSFIQGIIKNDPSQEKFEKGWMNRLEDFR